MKLLLAHDLGTTGNKATLFRVDGKMLGSLTYPYPTHYFHATWAEQNPEDWWRAICETTRQLLSGYDPKDVAAVSFSGQMMGCVLVDRQGRPLRDAIIWADQRATAEADWLSSRIDPRQVYQITGHRLSASYSLEKLLWIKAHEPEVYRQAYRLLLPKDYLVYRLTGRFATDYSDASGTNAFDLNRFVWSSPILDAAQVRPELFPEALPSTTVAGEVTAQVARECGLAQGTPIVMGGGDGVCAAVGAGSVAENLAYNYLGSSSWIALTTKAPIYDEQMRTFTWAHIVPGMYAPTGTMQAAGNSMSFMKRVLGDGLQQQAAQLGISVYDLINAQIEQSPIGANGLIYLPYLLGERSPRWNPDARGAFIGLKMEHEKADLLRAAVEGVFLNLRIILDIFRSRAPIQRMSIIGGLAKGNVERRMLADVYNLTVDKLNYLEEATSMGAAVTAGVGVGVLPDFSVIHHFIQVEESLTPLPGNAKQYEELLPLFNQCYDALLSVYGSLSKQEEAMR